MVLDPVLTFFVYFTAIAFLFALTAAAADLWGAKVERDERRRARAAARRAYRESRGPVDHP